MALEKAILLEANRFKKENKQIIKLIKRYKKIAIFRHIKPDFDALGTQFGLRHWLLDNFFDKDIKVFGDNHVTLTPRLFPETDKVNDSWFDEPFLAIIVDVGSKSRVADPRFEKAAAIIKIDHHPYTDDIADVDVTDTETAAASELVVALLLAQGKKYTLSRTAAEYFYIALVGDSGRFSYSSTSQLSFAVASHLIGTGFKVNDIIQKMFVKQIEDLEIMSYILNHYTVSPKGVAYYVLDSAVQEKLHITTERGKENVNMFANIDGIHIWCSITEDPNPSDYCWRISIRSKKIAINGVATKWGGGGHEQASGARINSLNELEAFIKDLEDVIPD